MLMFCFLFVLSMHYMNQSSKLVVPLQLSPASIHVINSFSFHIPIRSSLPSRKRPLYFWNTFICPSTRSAAAASSDITFQVSCIRYPAWISDSRNNSCQLDWLSDENCQVVEIINAFVSSKYLLLSSFLQLYWRTGSFLRSAHWHWHVKSSTGTL